jgi:hypothetical protein
MDRFFCFKKIDQTRKNHTQTETMNPEVTIIQAKHLGGYCLELEFGDGKRQKVNFESFLRKSLHPEIQSYLAMEKFKQFRLEHGDLVWGDYDLCFPIMDLYENQILHNNADLMAA